MGQILEALGQLFVRFGFIPLRAQWYAVCTLAGYVGLVVLSIFLSSWDAQWLVWVILAFYTLGVILIMFSPVLWGGVAATGYLRGQAGGEEGFSIEDGINRVKDWGPKVLDTSGKFLLFYGAVPFIWTGYFSTKGYEEWTLAFLIVLPAIIYASNKLWPAGNSVFRLITGVLIVGIVIIILGTVFNTVQRKMADPAVLVVGEVLAKQEQERLAQDKRAAEHIKKKLAASQPLTSDEKLLWGKLLNEQKQQSLHPKNLLPRAEKFALESQPKSAVWWHANYHLIIMWMVGGLLALFIAYRVYRLFATPTSTVSVSGGTVVTVAATSSTTHAGRRSWGWVLWLIPIALIGGLGYLWYTGEIGYKKTLDLVISDLQDQTLCVKPGKRKFSFPRETLLDEEIRRGRLAVQQHPNWRYIKASADDTLPSQYNIADHIRVNGSVPGEEVVVPDNCKVTVSHAYTAEFKRKAVIIGNLPNTPPQAVGLRITFE